MESNWICGRILIVHNIHNYFRKRLENEVTVVFDKAKLLRIKNRTLIVRSTEESHGTR